jgi:hypothetical protein
MLCELIEWHLVITLLTFDLAFRAVPHSMLLEPVLAAGKLLGTHLADDRLCAAALHMLLVLHVRKSAQRANPLASMHMMGASHFESFDLSLTEVVDAVLFQSEGALAV